MYVHPYRRCQDYPGKQIGPQTIVNNNLGIIIFLPNNNINIILKDAINSIRVIKMGPQERTRARSNLDRKLDAIRASGILERPQRGWIKAIREALGMTTAQFGRRMGVSQPRAVNVEQAELTGKITMESLQRAAEALNCRLVYALVPHESLEAQVEERARTLAQRHIEAVSHSMALEDQRARDEDTREQLERLIQKLLNAPGSKLWDDR